METSRSMVWGVLEAHTALARTRTSGYLDLPNTNASYPHNQGQYMRFLPGEIKPLCSHWRCRWLRWRGWRNPIRGEAPKLWYSDYFMFPNRCWKGKR